MHSLLLFLLCQSCRSLRNISLHGQHVPFLDLIRRPFHSWLSMMGLSADPFFSLALSLPTLTPPLVYSMLSSLFFIVYIRGGQLVFDWDRLENFLLTRDRPVGE